MIQYSSGIIFFIRKFFYFWAPLIVFFLILEIVVFHSGEFWSIEKVISTQTKDNQDFLFGRGVIGQALRVYKYKSVLAKQPDVLVLGSSRVMQIREEMFSSDESFYNAGGLVHNVADLVDFIKLLPDEAKPKIIILGVDFFWFGEKSDFIYGLSEDLKKRDDAYKWQAHLYADRFLLLKSIKNKSLSIFNKIFERREPIENNQAIGLNALFGDGFREDGSYQYGRYLLESIDQIEFTDRENIVDKIKKGNNPFEQGNVFSENREAIFAKFLEISRERGIKVVGLALPFSSEVFKELENSSYQKKLFNDFKARIPALFLKLGFEFFDYSDLSSLNLNDLYMFDGMHSSEVVMGNIMVNVYTRLSTEGLFNYKLSPNLFTQINNNKTTPTQIYFGK